MARQCTLGTLHKGRQVFCSRPAGHSQLHEGKLGENHWLVWMEPEPHFPHGWRDVMENKYHEDTKEHDEEEET